jgi:FMN reductase
MSFIAQASMLQAAGISSSPSGRESKSRMLLDHALARLGALGIACERIDLSSLPADALLGRVRDAALERALAAAASARIVLAATPIYRATYSGLLKVFFDLFPHGALAGAIAIPIATGGSPGHLLAIDHGLRPLFSSLGAVVVPTNVYAADEQFADGVPSRALLERLDRAVAEAIALALGARGGLEPVSESYLTRETQAEQRQVAS